MEMTTIWFEKWHLHCALPVALAAGSPSATSPVGVRGFLGLASPDGISQASWGSIPGPTTSRASHATIASPTSHIFPPSLPLLLFPLLLYQQDIACERCYSNDSAFPNLFPLVKPCGPQRTKLQTFSSLICAFYIEEFLTKQLLRSALKYVITPMKTSSYLFNNVSRRVEAVI